MLRLLRLASEGGDVQAQETLAMVLIAGDKLYGKHIRANLCEAQMWTRRAALQGSDVARFQVMFLNRAAQARRAADHCGPVNSRTAPDEPADAPPNAGPAGAGH